MPKFRCSYAYDIPAYFDFTVEAADEAEAEKKIEEALTNRKFDKICCDPSFEDGGDNPRVFVSGPADDDEEVDDLDNLKG
jgi:hypothetical protein